MSAINQEIERRREARELEAVAAPAVPDPAACETIESARTCDGCGKTFVGKSVVINGAPIIVGTWCEPCIQDRNRQVREEAEAEIRAERAASWRSICPDDYRDTDIERVRSEWQSKGLRATILSGGQETPITLEEILALDPKGGLLLAGETGRFKTRILFQLVERYFFAGLDVAYINGATFADKLAARYSDGAGAAERWVQKHISAPILFYDDLGKEPTQGRERKMSERSEEALYRILEERKSARRPFHGSTNLLSPTQFLARLSEDRGKPMLRRLQQMARTVTIV